MKYILIIMLWGAEPVSIEYNGYLDCLHAKSILVQTISSGWDDRNVVLCAKQGWAI